MIKKVIVVEGKNDKTQLKNFFNCDVIITGGFDLGENKIKLLNKINKQRGLIVLLDNDPSGLKIRKKLNENIKNLENIYIPNNKPKEVELLDKKTLDKMFANVKKVKEDNKIKPSNLIKLGVTNKRKRNKIFDYLEIRKGNLKHLTEIVNILNIGLEEVKVILDAKSDS